MFFLPNRWYTGSASSCAHNHILLFNNVKQNQPSIPNVLVCFKKKNREHLPHGIISTNLSQFMTSDKATKIIDYEIKPSWRVCRMCADNEEQSRSHDINPQNRILITIDNKGTTHTHRQCFVQTHVDNSSYNLVFQPWCVPSVHPDRHWQLLARRIRVLKK